jgi:hypothetical protein
MATDYKKKLNSFEQKILSDKLNTSKIGIHTRYCNVLTLLVHLEVIDYNTMFFSTMDYKIRQDTLESIKERQIHERRWEKEKERIKLGDLSPLKKKSTKIRNYK